MNSSMRVCTASGIAGCSFCGFLSSSAIAEPIGVAPRLNHGAASRGPLAQDSLEHYARTLEVFTEHSLPLGVLAGALQALELGPRPGRIVLEPSDLGVAVVRHHGTCRDHPSTRT